MTMQITFQSSLYNTLGTFVADKKKIKLVLMDKPASRHFYPFSYELQKLKDNEYKNLATAFILTSLSLDLL